MAARSDVVVVGAGAAGLTAAYHLQKADLSVRVLEASDRIGGRLREDSALADFPIDLGGSWIHGRHPRKILRRILGGDDGDDGDAAVGRVETVLHNPRGTRVWTRRGSLPLPPVQTCLRNDHKWVGSTWWGFFHDRVASALAPGTIVLNSPVTAVDYGRRDENDDDDDDGTRTGRCTVACADGTAYRAAYVLITVSMQILKDESIRFNPTLPKFHLRAIKRYHMGHAMKVFLKFREKFYPSYFYVAKDLIKYSYFNESSANFAQRDFWDETYGQSTDAHVLGMFCYGRLCDRYLALRRDGGDAAVIGDVLSELDAMFDGRASRYHERSVVAMWSDEPHVRTGYTHRCDGDAIEEMRWPAGDGRVHFAGEAVPVDRENWGFAHGAAYSGRDAARKIVELERKGRFKQTRDWSGCAVV